jgi:oxaloacetate decarboxylase alpha subunit
MGTKRAGIMDTTLRDGHQSLWATRMRTSDMLPVLPLFDKVGFASMEVWGGATFDTCLRFLDEDPWERLRTLRREMPNTKLQMLLRGQNILGYKHYPDDVVVAFVNAAVKNGIDIIRIFDALNDVRNMEASIKAAKAAKAHVQGTVVYTISPVHTLDSFVDTARQLVNLGIDSLCIKDMAGLLSPGAAFSLVTAIKKEFGSLPLQIHSHFTSGMADMAYLKALEAGADIIDTALSPLALGSSQPATESMVAALRDTQYDTGLDLNLLTKIAEHFNKIKAGYETGVASYQVDTNVLLYQIPGGMISNFRSQLGTAINRLPEVLAEVPRVRADLGYPPLVTPSSQIVGSQAVMNVLGGERYKMVTNEVKNYLRGLYGRPPGTIDESFRKSIIGDAEVVTARPADGMAPMLESAKKEMALYFEQDEDVLSYAVFPEPAMKFFKSRAARKYGVDPNLAEQAKDQGYPV